MRYKKKQDFTLYTLHFTLYFLFLMKTKLLSNIKTSLTENEIIFGISLWFVVASLGIFTTELIKQSEPLHHSAPVQEYMEHELPIETDRQYQAPDRAIGQQYTNETS